MSKPSPYNTPDYVELYVRLGGAPVVERAAGGFCDALLSDRRLATFFAGIDRAKLRARIIAFFTMALGGPNAYDGRDLRNAHAGARDWGLTDAHLDIALQHCAEAFAAAGASPALVQEVGSYLQSMRDDILGL
jgi:hemoglobin